MYRGTSSRVLPIILILVAIGVAVIVLIAVGRAIFGGGDAAQPETDTARQALLNTSVDNSVRMTVRGPIVANEQFHLYRISVSPESRSLTTYTGYLERVTGTKTLDSSTRAYEEFVYALDKANFTQGSALAGEEDDTRGICATGSVYEFEIIESGSTVNRLWTSTCEGSKGSFRASLPQVRSLFTNQIPDSDELISDIDL